MQTNISYVNRDQWIVRICLGLLALSLISILLVYWLQFRLAAYHPLGYTPELPVQEKSAIMEKATRLRDLWRTWALSSRPELVRSFVACCQ
jgi:hypothetical protein